MGVICHVQLAGYTDGLGYQENLLSKKHVQLGYEVHLVTVVQEGGEPIIYQNQDGVIIHRLPINPLKKKFLPYFNGYIKKTKGLYEVVDKIHPNIIFVHGTTLPDNVDIIKYKNKHQDTIIYSDSHLDYYNKPVISLKQKICQYTYARYYSKILSKICKMVWGVTPWRIQYLVDVLGVPKEKVDLLVMGGDEDYIDWEHRAEIRESVRKELGVPQDAFLVITGGKFDMAKNLHLLVDAIKELQNVYLIIFGKYEMEMANYESTINCDRIKNIGWIPSELAYRYFLSSDLCCFPGTHSVLWEQACASGIPAIFKDWDGGFNHLDVGGNCILLKNPTVDNLRQTIFALSGKNAMYQRMKDVAENKARTYFSYITIAKRAIGRE